MAMTLEQVRDKLRFEQSLQIARGCPWDAEEPGAMADAIDAHITQPAQAVDVEDVRTLLECLEDEHGGDHFEADCRHCRAFDQLTRALAGEQAGPVARPLSEYHEDHGTAVWWSWDTDRGEWMGEPAWIGRPDDEDWPGYHTHYTPHPTFPTSPLRTRISDE